MHLFRFLPTVVILAVVVAVLTGAFPASADAQGKYCSPWPGCKNEGSGDPPGLSTCNIQFRLASNTCMAADEDGMPTGEECVLVRPKDGDYAWILAGHCRTSAALVLGMESPTSPGNINRVLIGDGYTLHLVPNPNPTLPVWSGGRAAITNLGGTTRVADLHIHVSDPLVANGCSGPVEAAVSLNGASGIPMMAAAFLTVTVGASAQFCTVIERVGGTGGGSINDNVIGPNSYGGAGILVSSVSGNVAMSENRVHDSDKGCVGIQMGPSAEANIANNDVTAPGCADPGTGTRTNNGVGIRVQGIAASETVSIFRNIVSIENGYPNANVGIDILSSALLKNEGNAIMGDGGDQPYQVDAASVSGVPFPVNGRKKNTCNGDTIFSGASFCP